MAARQVPKMIIFQPLARHMGCYTTRYEETVEDLATNKGYFPHYYKRYMAKSVQQISLLKTLKQYLHFHQDTTKKIPVSD